MLTVLKKEIKSNTNRPTEWENFKNKVTSNLKISMEWYKKSSGNVSSSDVLYKALYSYRNLDGLDYFTYLDSLTRLNQDHLANSLGIYTDYRNGIMVDGVLFRLVKSGVIDPNETDSFVRVVYTSEDKITYTHFKELDHVLTIVEVDLLGLLLHYYKFSAGITIGAYLYQDTYNKLSKSLVDKQLENIFLLGVTYRDDSDDLPFYLPKIANMAKRGYRSVNKYLSVRNSWEELLWKMEIETPYLNFTGVNTDYIDALITNDILVFLESLNGNDFGAYEIRYLRKQFMSNNKIDKIKDTVVKDKLSTMMMLW